MFSPTHNPRSLFSRLTSAHRIAVDLLGERVARMRSEALSCGGLT